MMESDTRSVPLIAYAEDLRTALCIRRVEERLLSLFQEGKLFGTVHTCIGQEFSGVAICRSLQACDTIFSNHRCHGHFLAYCGDIEGLIGEVMGRQNGVCGGRGGSQHLQRDNFYSNGIQGGIVPVALGLAIGHKSMATGGISVVFIGDGTLGEGVVYESMNIAAKWELPILFVCENNLYAQSTHQHQTLSGNISARAGAFGIETAQSNTWEWEQLFSDVKASIDSVRTTSRPVFHQIDTYRLMAHSKGDDDRIPEDVESYRRRDPLNVLIGAHAVELGLSGIVEELDEQIDRAVARCEQSSFATESTQESHVETAAWTELSINRERCVESIRRGLRIGLSERKDVVLIGEDIESPYGGAFKCTLGLSDAFPGRVRNTPISEGAIVGMANGMALAGMLPVVEIMFGDFLTLAADQWINHAAKFSWMYNDKVNVPLVIRTPMGGRRGYAATHSQSIEKHFLGLPGTQVLCLNHRFSPADLYGKLFSCIDRPTLIIENKVLYTRYVGEKVPDGFALRSNGKLFPMVNLHPLQPADITLVAVGGMSMEVEDAAIELFVEHEVIADVYMPTVLYPFDIEAIVPSVGDTGRLLVIEEGQSFASLGSEIVAQVAERAKLPVKFGRLAAKPFPIPAARPLEEQYLPSAKTVVDKVLELLVD